MTKDRFKSEVPNNTHLNLLCCNLIFYEIYCEIMRNHESNISPENFVCENGAVKTITEKNIVVRGREKMAPHLAAFRRII